MQKYSHPQQSEQQYSRPRQKGQRKLLNALMAFIFTVSALMMITLVVSYIQSSNKSDQSCASNNSNSTYLYRAGSANRERFLLIQPKDYDTTTGMVTPGKSPKAQGISTQEDPQFFVEQGFTGTLWRLPAFSCVPKGVHFIKDHDKHWALEPDKAISPAEYATIVNTPDFQSLWEPLGKLPKAALTPVPSN